MSSDEDNGTESMEDLTDISYGDKISKFIDQYNLRTDVTEKCLEIFLQNQETILKYPIGEGISENYFQERVRKNTPFGALLYKSAKTKNHFYEYPHDCKYLLI